MDYPLLRRLISQWPRIAPHFYGDYYPLLPYSRDDEQWMAWQFNRPDLREGTILVFRRSGSPYESACFRLQGLEPETTYTLTDLDTEEAITRSGKELMTAGLPVVLDEQPLSGCLSYRSEG